MDPREKARTKYHLLRDDGAVSAFSKALVKGKTQTGQSLSREARSTQRRQLAVLGEDALNSDLLKFNQLKVINLPIFELLIKSIEMYIFLLS